MKDEIKDNAEYGNEDIVMLPKNNQTSTECVETLQDLKLKFDTLVNQIIQKNSATNSESKKYLTNLLNSLTECESVDECWLECFFDFISFKSGTIDMNTETRRVAFSMIIRVIEHSDPNVIAKHFLDSAGKWILDPSAQEFVMRVAALFGTVFPPPEILYTIQQSQVGLKNLHSKYDNVLADLLNISFPPARQINERVVSSSKFIKRLEELKLSSVSEDTFALEIFISIICSGSKIIRNTAAKKVGIMLSNPGLVRVVSQLISVIIYNTDIAENDLDFESAKCLLTLKIKVPLENLVDKIIGIWLSEHREKVFHVLQLFLSLSGGLLERFMIRALNIVQALIEWHLKPLIDVLVELWYKRDDVSLIFICNVIKLSQSQVISVFLKKLFETSFESMNFNFFIVQASKTIGFLFLEYCFENLKAADQLPSQSPSRSVVLDDQLVQCFHNARLIFLTSIAKFLSALNVVPDNIASNVCIGIRNILLIQPVHYYFPVCYQSRIVEVDYEFVKHQLILLIVSNDFNIISNILELISHFSVTFSQCDDEILRIFATVFDFLLNLEPEYDTFVHDFANAMLQGNVIDSLFHVCHRPPHRISKQDIPFSQTNHHLAEEINGWNDADKGTSDVSASKHLKITTFITLQKIYIKLFLMSPKSVGSIIFQKYLCIKYIVLSCVFPGIEPNKYLEFEDAKLSRVICYSDPSFEVDNYILIDLTRNIFDFSNFPSFVDNSQKHLFSNLIYENYEFLNIFMERLWHFSIEKHNPFTAVSLLSFIPHFMHQCPVDRITQLPVMLQIMYLSLSYFKCFLQENLSKLLIVCLQETDFTQILGHLNIMLTNRHFANAGLLLFFILTSQIKDVSDYLNDFSYLESYIFDVKFQYLRDTLVSAIERAFLVEKSPIILTIDFWFMKLVSSETYFNTILNLVKGHHRLVSVLVKDHPRAFRSISNLLMNFWPLSISEDDIFAVELLLSLKNDIDDDSYSTLRNKLFQISDSFHFRPEYYLTSIQFGHIIKSNDLDLVNFFVEHVSFENNEPSIDFLVKSLEITQYASSSFIIVIRKLFSLVEFTVHQKWSSFPRWCQSVREILIVQKNALNADIIRQLTTIFSITQPLVARKTINPISETNGWVFVHTYHQISQSTSSPSQITKSSFEDSNIEVLSEGDSVKHGQIEYVLPSSLSDCEISLLLQEQVENDPLTALASIKKGKYYVNHYLSYQTLLKFLNRLSEMKCHQFTHYSGEVLNIICSLHLHPQLFISRRTIEVTRDLLNEQLPNHPKFAKRLFHYLVLEIINGDFDNLTSKLEERYFIWIYVLKQLDHIKIEGILNKHIEEATKFDELIPSIQILLIFVNLNCPNAFYDRIYENFDFCMFYKLCSRIKQTYTDESTMKLLKKAFDCISVREPDTGSQLRFLNFCKIFKLYPLLIIKNFSYFLTCLHLSLKTASLPNPNVNKNRQEAILVMQEILKILQQFPVSEKDEIQMRKINIIFDLVMEKEGTCEVNIESDIVDLLIVKFKENEMFNKLTILPIMVAYWLIIHPIQSIPALKNQMVFIGDCLFRTCRKSLSITAFIKSYISLFVVIPHLFQDKILENILFSKTYLEDETILDQHILQLFQC
ncbi:hypothetical protein RF11_00185 [Thelohanellus kitauei]|uniref:Uncharacterized protein n=1 Tax=Thelohanellus kitauei TaxID=669202 RepID=A0A0C2N1Z1_THEKT|nr:hypothetical protein RF11_00185 [Thelohanellus kitauei]